MAWNNPKWGKNNDGPPDLDEIWRQFNSRLNGLFKVKNQPPKQNKPWHWAFIFLALFVLTWLVSGFYMVNAGQQALVLRFGKLVATTQAGVNWHIPFPIDTVDVVDIQQIHTVEIGYRDALLNKIPKETQMLTRDGQVLDMQYFVQYTIQNPKDYLFNNRSPDEAVRQIAESVMSESVARSTWDELMPEQHADIVAHAEQRIQDRLNRYQTGIRVHGLSIQSVQAPQETQAAFADALKAKQDGDKLLSDTNAYVQNALIKAQTLAAAEVLDATSYKQSVVDAATADVARFKPILAQYLKTPDITKENLYLSTMQQVLAHATTVVTDGRQTEAQNLPLSLDQWIKLTHTTLPLASPLVVTTPTPPVAAVNPVTPQTDAAGNVVVNTRAAAQENLHSRDREYRP